MKKISRKDLQGLRGLFPVLEREEMRRYIGGAHGYGAGYYTQDEYDRWEGPWPGGWVEGWGYVFPDEATCYGYYYTPPTTPPPVWVNYEDDYYDYYTDSDNNGYPGYRRPNGYYIYYYDNYYNSGEGGSSSNDPNDIERWYAIIREILRLNPNPNSYAQKWNTMVNAYVNILRSMGLDVYYADFYYSDEERPAKAWIDNRYGRKTIAIGASFFNETAENSISVLVHEYMHITYDEDCSYEGRDYPDLYYYGQDVPEEIKEYIKKTEFNGREVTADEYNIYFSSNRMAVDPTYYRNEQNAYIREKELNPNVSPEYREARDYRIWLYGRLAERAEENQYLQ